MQSDYQQIQDRVLGYLRPIAEHLGFYYYSVNTGLLWEVETYSYAVLFIDLAFSVLLLILVVVSCLLIFSLLMVTVEAKTFDYGVIRLMGLSKCGIVGMVLTQAALFVLPSVALGFVLSLPCIKVVYQQLFTKDVGQVPEVMLTWQATAQALLIGVFIPVVSSIVPIRRALSRSVTESLSVQRTKLSGVLITFTDRNKKKVAPFVLFGSVTLLFGVCVYYYLPRGLLKQ